ncbi:MAG: hypothetical protein LQ345_002688 [Seirophora villosa]|nr:MAG: hypothetical protein LQ345_002688 [Seirophora villosa]
MLTSTNEAESCPYLYIFYREFSTASSIATCNMPKTAFVTGATGLLGRQVLRAFDHAGWRAVGSGFTRAKPPILKVDLQDQDAIDATLDETKPQVIIHCAANRFPDKCDADPDGTRALNIAATRRVALAARSRSILLIYISTDYVFAGKPGQAPYEADAAANPTSLYGRTKLAGEKAVLEVCGDTGWGIMLRVPVLYGHAETSAESAINVLMDAVWKASERDAQVSIDDWSIRYPTNTEDVARVLVEVAMRYLVADEARVAMPRILQFSSEDRFTKFQICQLFAEIMGLPLEGLNGTGEDKKVPRPYDTHLSTKVLKELGVDVRTVDFRDWWYIHVNLI